MKRATLALAAALLVSASSLAQTPAGSEFRINTATTGNQFFGAAAALDDGFVVVWSSDQYGPDFRSFAQVLDRRGVAVGAEFRLHISTTGRQWFPDVDRVPGGRFVVAWESAGFDGYFAGVAVRVFQGAGVPATPELQANTYTTGQQAAPSIASDAAGNFVVVWNSYQQDGSSWGVFGQRFNGNGTRLGGEFQVNTAATGVQFAHYGGAVAMDGAGRFVVVWDGDGHVHGQRFAADGLRMGDEFQVDVSTGGHGTPAVDATDSGDFVVAWTGTAGIYPNRILARRYAADGSPLGSEVLVNVSPLAGTPHAAVSLDGAGNSAIAWMVSNSPPQATAFLRRHLADGAPRGGEVTINLTASGTRPQIASDPSGTLLATWEYAATIGDSDVWGRRFGGLLPGPMTVDTAGNGVWEPGEAVDVRPSWRNDNGAALTFGGSFSAVTGPAGATYTTTDGTGGYGTVPDATTAACADCYGVSVTAPATRPATHWDASVTEAIVPDALGQMQRWRLHLGDSFTDVPRASVFYPFVETLLHHGVTGGCTATAFCPVDATARAQMAVFALGAKEGALYAPPPCATPVFDDVPAASPFCPWIEELARRGVVAGCGGSSYCPGGAVTRAEMAVFVLRTLDPTLTPPACTTPTFIDVPATSTFCPWIEELVRRGVVAGCGASSYCPAAPVTREQMGVFVSLTFGLALYGP